MERFENDIVIMISLSCRRIVFNENATTTTNYSNYLDTQTIDFGWFLALSIVFVKTAGNDIKATRKRYVDAIRSLRFH